MSPLRPPPAAATRRGAGLELPKSPLPSSAKLPPPPRPSSMVRFELKPCSTTSVEYFSTPLWSVHLRVCSWPSMYTLAPFFRYCSAILQSPSLKMTTRCHSVFSLRSPVALSRQVSEVATLRLAIGRPSWVRRISGSLPRFPTRITLFTLPAIAALHAFEITGRTGQACKAASPLPFGRPIRSTARLSLRSSRPRPGYPHIAPQAAMFQFCSGIFPSPAGVAAQYNPGNRPGRLPPPEIPSNSLTCSGLSSSASVAFGRRHLEGESGKFCSGWTWRSRRKPLRDQRKRTRTGERDEEAPARYRRRNRAGCAGFCRGSGCASLREGARNDRRRV